MGEGDNDDGTKGVKEHGYKYSSEVLNLLEK
jgi:hypothetical protein